MQVATSPVETELLRKKRIDTEGLAAYYRTIIREVALKMNLAGRIGFLQLDMRVRGILGGNSWSEGAEEESGVWVR